MGGRCNYYVVFKGRRVGIFEDWDDCQAQVNGFSGMAFQGFHTRDEAEAAWQRSRSRTVGKQINENNEEDMEVVAPPQSSGAGPSCSSLLQSLEGLSLEGKTIPENERESPKQDFLVEYSLQALLGLVCETLKIPPPMWSLVDSKVHGGVLHHQYSVAVAGGGIYRPAIQYGKFNVEHEDARDSAALNMLHVLLRVAGKRVKDYNYHAVSDMTEEHNQMAALIESLRECLVQNETQFADLAAESKKKDDQITIMAEEIARLEQEVRSLRGVLGW